MMYGETVKHTRRETYRSPIGQTMTRDVELPPIRGCSLQVATTAENPSDAADIAFKVSTEVILYVPPRTDVRPLDMLTVRGGIEYEVEGQPVAEVNGFTGTQSMIPVRLRRVSQ